MRIKTLIIMLIACAVGSISTNAQYYQLANQLTSLLSPALSGSVKYKGFVEANGIAGIGNNHANFVGISTTQGFQYASWFFMGVGMGIDMAKGQDMSGSDININSRATATTRAMIPVFSDFRFNIPNGNKTSLFIDLKLGGAWIIGNRYLQLENAALTTAAQFYMVPSIGLRIPVNSDRPKQAFNLGVTYQLLTANNHYYNDNSVTLHGLGVTLGFEW